MSIFNKIYSAGTGQTGGQYYIIGRVTKVILGPYLADTRIPDPDYSSPADIGKIKYDLLYTTLSTPKSDAVSEAAYPVFNFIKQYPVLHETVFIIPGPTEELNDRKTRQQFFYFPSYNIWQNPNHGAFPNQSQNFEFLKSYTNKPGYQGSSTKNPKIPLGLTFKEKEVRNLKSFEGDSIIQARFGQSIRFGSTVPVMKNQNTWSSKGENGDPITIILNSQGKRPGYNKMDQLVEDINGDGSAVYLTSTQQINLVAINKFPLNSFGKGIQSVEQNIIEVPKYPTSNYSTDAFSQDNSSKNT
jgi:hypothetical protein